MGNNSGFETSERASKEWTRARDRTGIGEKIRPLRIRNKEKNEFFDPERSKEKGVSGGKKFCFMGWEFLEKIDFFWESGVRIPPLICCWRECLLVYYFNIFASAPHS